MERLYHTRTLEKVRARSIEEQIWQKVIKSPIGPLTLGATRTALVSLTWGKVVDVSFGTMKGPNAVLAATERQLTEYFSGKRQKFDLPLDMIGTDFQQSVWNQLSKIPYGACITYGEQARRVKRPKAYRAVGAANGKNPIGIIVPCHRVIGASGDLTGFAGGLRLKQQLLELEQSVLSSSL